MCWGKLTLVLKHTSAERRKWDSSFVMQDLVWINGVDRLGLGTSIEHDQLVRDCIDLLLFFLFGVFEIF